MRQIYVDAAIAFCGLALSGALVVLANPDVGGALTEAGVDVVALTAGVVAAQQAFNRIRAAWDAWRRRRPVG